MFDMNKRMHGVLLLLLLAMPGISVARQTVEASTVVTGSIVVTPDGSVSRYTLDHPEKLSKGIVELVAKNLPEWKFRPYLVDGRPVVAKAPMSIRLVARRLDNGRYNLWIRGATFGLGASGKSTDLKVKRVVPKYPPQAIRARVSGTVYLVAKVNRQGEAEDVQAQQVNLRERGSEARMKRWRRVLSEAAASAVRRWTFEPPASVRSGAEPYWVVRIPVSFNLRLADRPPPDPYGRWQPYVPGPMNFIPWVDPREVAAGSVDAIPSGSIRRVHDQGLQLKTALGGS